jgi:hypothetical protein
MEKSFSRFSPSASPRATDRTLQLQSALQASLKARVKELKPRKKGPVVIQLTEDEEVETRIFVASYALQTLTISCFVALCCKDEMEELMLTEMRGKARKPKKRKSGAFTTRSGALWWSEPFSMRLT